MQSTYRAAEFEELQQSLKKKQGPVQVSDCLDSQKVHLMQETMADRPWKLVVTYDDARAKEIYDDFGCFRDNVWLYPAKDLLFYSADIHGNLMGAPAPAGTASSDGGCFRRGGDDPGRTDGSSAAAVPDPEQDSACGDRTGAESGGMEGAG